MGNTNRYIIIIRVLHVHCAAVKCKGITITACFKTAFLFLKIDKNDSVPKKVLSIYNPSPGGHLYFKVDIIRVKKFT